MFDKYLIVDGSLHNVSDGGDVTGFAFDVRIAYYRGLALSMIEPFDITVDDVSYSPDQVSFTVHGNTYSFPDMENEVDDRWELAEAATLTVTRPGGLAAGEHQVTIMEYLRVSYMPKPTETPCTKTLQVAA